MIAACKSCHHRRKVKARDVCALEPTPVPIVDDSYVCSRWRRSHASMDELDSENVRLKSRVVELEKRLKEGG